ncbi:hypothetical protein ACEE21_08210 [Clostridium baratii]
MRYINDPYYPVPKGCYKDLVVIVLSVSGEAEQKINYVNRFKGKNFNIALITNS